MGFFSLFESFWEDSGSVSFLPASVFVEVSLVVFVLFFGRLSLSRSEVFLEVSEVVLEEFVAFDVELSFFNREVELSFFFRREVELSFFSWEVELICLSSDLERVLESVVAFVELVGLESLVWFLVDKFDLISLVWFLVDWFDDLMSLVWLFLVNKLELFFFSNIFSSSSSSSSNLLLAPNRLV